MLKKAVGFSMAILLIFAVEGLTKKPNLLPKQQLGKQLFFDKKLSDPPGQSCAACHAPQAGYNGIGNAKVIIYEGAIDTRHGNRNAPAAAYSSFSPVFHQDENGQYVGGQFWDGRAATLEDQAKGPFLNPVEQNLTDKAAAVKVVRNSGYARLFCQIYGENAFDDVDKAYNLIADAIAAFERSEEVNRFSSKYDAYLAGDATLTADEKNGLQLFEGKGKCMNCHPNKLGANGEPPLFTDFTYDNIGIPKNPNNPFYTVSSEFNPDGKNWVDYGLGGHLKSQGVTGYESQLGKFKVPTLRNIAVAPPYTHNGYFKNLYELVHFYNTRDLATWPAPEVAQNLNNTELGNLGLTPKEEYDLIAFLKTLTDGYEK